MTAHSGLSKIHEARYVIASHPGENNNTERAHKEEKGRRSLS